MIRSFVIRKLSTYQFLPVMLLKFSANFGFLFVDKANLIDRYEAAGLAGFHGVEGPFPTGYTISEVVNATVVSRVKQVMLNIAVDDIPNEQYGIAAFTNHEKKFQANFDSTLALAKALDCRKIHVMAGKLCNPPTAENHAAYITNLQYVAKKLENENIIALIEPINRYSLPGYYLNCYKKAVEVIDTIDSPKIRLMLDLFHLQMIQGNIINTIKELFKYIGHVQIAQAPNRNEPDSDGEVNLEYVLYRLVQSGYNDWIGCEYIPRDGVVNGLKWIKKYGYEL